MIRDCELRPIQVFSWSAVLLGLLVLSACTTTQTPGPPAMSGTPAGASPVATSSSTSGLVGEDVRVERVRYGESPWQAGNLRVPPGVGPFPVVVFIHGGFWRAGFNETLMAALAEDAVGRGVVTWNFDYRAVGHPGGGYPGTLEDVAAALDHLTGVDEPLDLEDVVVVGHSAGGHLALRLALDAAADEGTDGGRVRDAIAGTVRDARTSRSAAQLRLLRIRLVIM